MKTRTIVAGMVSIVGPLLYLVVWYSANNAYPGSDESMYVHTAQKVQSAFVEKGFIAGLQSAYFDRWKPIFHPLLAVPALIMTHGHVLHSVALTMCVLYGIFLLYVFLLLREKLTLEAATLGTLFMGFLTGVVENVTTFDCELPTMLCAVALIYHFLKSANFTIRRHVIFSGFWLALGLCIRPDEMGLLFFLPITYIFYSEYKKNHLRGTWKNWLLISGLVFGLVLFWYGPFILELKAWVYTASFGGFTKITGHRTGVGYFNFLSSSFKNIFGYPFLVLCLLILGADPWGKYKNIFLPLILATTPIFIGGLSYNADQRYYAGVGTVLYLAALMMALSEHQRFYRLKIGGVAILGLCSILYAWGQILEPLGLPELRPPVITRWRMNPEPPYREIEPAIKFIETLEKFLPSQNKLKIYIIPHSDSQDFQVWLADPWVLNTVAHERGHRWEFEIPWDHSDTNIKQLRFVQKNFDYVISGPLEKKYEPIITPEEDLQKFQKLAEYTAISKGGQSGRLLLLKPQYSKR
jgi:hypothetical protein